MSTPEQFDPYREWLGIEPREQPADHYRLLGLARFEEDPARIAAAADERMATVRRFQVGPRGRDTQSLLNELSAAKICLLSPAAKAAYDAELARSMSTEIVPRRAALPPPPPDRPQVRSFAQTASLDLSDATLATPWYAVVLSITAATLVVLVLGLVWAVAQKQWLKEVPTTANMTPPPPLAEAEPEPPAAEPVVQVQEGSGEVFLAAVTADRVGGVELRSSGTEQVLANWTADEAQARWQFRLIVPGRFQVEVKYAAAADVTGDAVVLEVGDETEAMDLQTTGGLARSRTKTVSLEIANSGQHTLVVRPSQPFEGDWFALHSVRLIPVGGSEPPVLLTE